MILDVHGNPVSSKQDIKEIIPPPREVKKVERKHYKAGSPSHFERKLHCNHCGKKRLMRLATLFLDNDGKPFLFYFNLRKLKRALTQPNVNLPKTFIGNCFVCNENTAFYLNENRKLVADNSEVVLKRKDDNEGTDTSSREVPTNQN